MESTNRVLSNFSRSTHTFSRCFRPDKESHVSTIFDKSNVVELLARGNGLSYGDCCLLNQGTIIDTSRLDHLLSFDDSSGVAICQGGVTFADLFLLDPAFIPPVLPGTLYATVAGGVAHDVHGKNNHIAGSFGNHITWLELQIGKQVFNCSPSENSELFFATIAGLGLTGVIKRIGVRLRKASRYVSNKTEKIRGFDKLLQRMQIEGVCHDYQVAWLDLLNESRALLSLADHIEYEDQDKKNSKMRPNFCIPRLPIRLVNRWTMKQFNRVHYQRAKTENQIIPLWKFNNPLDSISNWNHLYGKKGLLQFQAVFDACEADIILKKLIELIRFHKAIATLAVLKYFTQPGAGLLTFVKPGFTLAIDFIHNQQARDAIVAMNQFITDAGANVYLAKDLLLRKEQFIAMYPNHEAFSNIRARYNSPMFSDLSKRLGIR